jgi:hypothetical protein
LVVFMDRNWWSWKYFGNFVVDTLQVISVEIKELILAVNLACEQAQGRWDDCKCVHTGGGQNADTWTGCPCLHFRQLGWFLKYTGCLARGVDDWGGRWYKQIARGYISDDWRHGTVYRQQADCVQAVVFRQQELEVTVDIIRLKISWLTLCAHCAQTADKWGDYYSKQVPCHWYSHTSITCRVQTAFADAVDSCQHISFVQASGTWGDRYSVLTVRGLA